jgi:hypothetical protein
VATFASTASDLVDGTDPVVFKEGNTVVHWGRLRPRHPHDHGERDGRGGQLGTRAVYLTVQDTTPPSLTSVASQTDEATSGAGAGATFAAIATDLPGCFIGGLL